MSISFKLKGFRNLLSLWITFVSFSQTGFAATNSLLKAYNLEGSVRRTFWTYLASQNTYRISDEPQTMTGTMIVGSPGYGAGVGLYSWTGPYSITVNQGTSDFDIQHAVFQLDVVWDPATGFPSNGGPKLNYNGGNQRLSAMPMLVDGVKEIPNNTGIKEMEHLGSFIYRGVTWQWDLSTVEADIHSVSIVMPFANHSSVVGARIDVASDFVEIEGNDVTPQGLWRQTFFQSTTNTGIAAETADADGDGLANLMEYALGTHPRSIQEDATPKAVFVDGRMKLDFKIPSTPPSEITYKVRVSDDLVTWKTLATKVGAAAWVWNGTGNSQIALTPTVERDRVVIGDEIIVSSKSKRFIWLAVSY